MHLKSHLDRPFPVEPRRWDGPIRSIGQLMIVVALSGVMLAVVLRMWPGPRRPGPVVVRAPGRVAVVPAQGPGLRSEERPMPDRFVIRGPAEIDPGMVVLAPADLDAGMVFNPETHRRGSSPITTAPDGIRVVPGPIPGPAPDPETPHRWIPSPRPGVRPGPGPH